MVKVDQKYLDEITKHYRNAADIEIHKLGENPDPDKVKELEQNFGSQAVQNVAYILSLGPKRIFEMGLSVDNKGWRDGYTKKTLQQRTDERRKKKKAAKIAQRIDRREK